MINEPLLNRFWQFHFSSHWFYCRLSLSQVLSGSICLRHQFSYSDFLTPKRPQFIFVCDINFGEKSFQMRKKEEMSLGNTQIFLRMFPFIIWYLIIISHLGSVRGWAVTPWPRCLQGSLSRVWTRAKTKHFARNSQFWDSDHSYYSFAYQTGWNVRLAHILEWNFRFSFSWNLSIIALSAPACQSSLEKWFVWIKSGFRFGIIAKTSSLLQLYKVLSLSFYLLISCK